MRIALRVAVPFAAAFAVCVVPGTAVAAEPPGYNVPGLAQYTEMLPTTGGGQATGSNTSSHALPPRLEAKLESQAAPTATALRLIATSAMFGAPQGKQDVLRSAAGGEVGLVTAATGSVGNGSVLAVIFALVVLSAAAIATRRRRPSA